MKINKFIILAIFSALLFTPSCKKEEEDEINYKNSFKGSIDFSLPEFVAPGDTYVLYPTGLTRNEEGKGIGYFWDCEKMGVKKDTTRVEADPLDKKGELKFHVKDTLGVFSMKCLAFADGYYTASKSKDFVIIHPTQSLSRSDLSVGSQWLTDHRDGKKYMYKKIGDLDWMIENLSYAGNGVSYAQCAAVDPVYGRYYTWEEAQTACPEGWRLPNEADWKNLFNSVRVDDNDPLKGIAGSLMGQATLNESKLWEFSEKLKITNASGFYALPTGFVQYMGDTPKYSGNMEYAAFWSAEGVEDKPEQAIYYYLFWDNPNMMIAKADKKSLATAIRCVRE